MNFKCSLQAAGNWGNEVVESLLKMLQKVIESGETKGWSKTGLEIKTAEGITSL